MGPFPVDYATAETFLGGLTDYERILGSNALTYDTKAFDMARFRAVLSGLGDPHLRYGAIHVAGTKGKGSTCAIVASLLRARGLRVGLYTSPHLAKFTERIQVDGEQVDDIRFAGLLAELAPRFTASDDGAGLRTVYELLTAAAFVHFAERNVDVAVVETGLGGRLDSTNVFDDPAVPLVNVITAIGFDHMGILGDTIEAIAGEKAGIIRPGASVVLGSQPPEWAATVRAVVDRHIAETGATLDPSGPSDQFNSGDFETLARLLPLPGAHQRDNLCTALAVAAAYAGRAGLAPADSATLACGVAAVRWPGRFEVLRGRAPDRPPVILDGAHCPMSFAAAARTYRETFGHRPLHLVIGTMRDKDLTAMLAALLGGAGLPLAAVTATTPPSPRGRAAAETAEALRRVFAGPVEAIDETSAAVTRAVAMCPPGGAVMVLGSLYLIEPARQAAAVPARTLLK